MIKLALVSVLAFSAVGCGVLMPAAGQMANGSSSTAASTTEPTSLTSAVENTPASPGSPKSESAASPATPSVVSVTLRSSCKDTVRVFYGQKPKFGSGTTSSLSANSVQSKQMKPGEMIWIVDASDNGVASATVSDTTKTIEVDASCTSLR